MIIFWNFIRENVEVIGTLATSLAFLATAWAAYEARHSAKAAMKATQLTAASLIEMKKNSFKQWLEVLLEQHDKMLANVNQALEDDEGIESKLSDTTITEAYELLIKTNLFIKYINHIAVILDYIDREFYLSSVSDEKKIYIEQLRNSINPRVILIISILSLKVKGNNTYNAKKLNTLLNKFNFFENEVFFSNSEVFSRDPVHYITQEFEAIYKKKIDNYIDDTIINHNAEIALQNIKKNTSNPKVIFAITWAYNNPHQRLLLEEFNNLPQFTRDKIEKKMKESVNEVATFNSKMHTYINFNFMIDGKIRREIKSKTDLERLIKIFNRFYKYRNTPKMKTVVFTDGFYSYDGIQITNELLNYALNEFYSTIKSDTKKEEIINKKAKEIEDIVDVYKSNLDQLSFK
ncbi:hypothetical protein [Cedecea neteri]|uniref:hypothetical protein n=1 Tax=Cedecea neteri TaxID=158822 RepID=UPI00289C5F88|nr:hypothetical protein [Cedecea neteri]